MQPSLNRRAVTLGLAATTAVALVGYLWLIIAGGEVRSASDLLAQGGFLSFVMGFAAVGMVLTLRRPDHTIGWLMAGLAALLAARSVGEQYALLLFERGSVSAAQWVSLVVNALEPVWLMALVALSVTFPHGTIPGPWWRRWLTTVAAFCSVGVLAAPFVTYQDADVSIPALLVPDVLSGGQTFLLLLPGWLLVFAAVLRIVRLLFRGGAVERRQIRWVALVLVVVILLLVAATWVKGAADLAGIAAGLGIPLAIAIGVTRYRLYEIDRVISRTVSYAVLLALLGTAFVVAVSIPTVVLGSADSPSWLVAGSTLAVAAAFSPARRRVQRSVDQRFNRSSYDAQMVIGGLGVALRDATDLDSVSEFLVGAASEVFHPASLGLWVRGGTA